MSKNKEAFFLKNDRVVITDFSNSDGVGIKDICNDGGEGSYVYVLNVSSSAPANTCNIYISDGSADIPLCSFIDIALNQGMVSGSKHPVRFIQSDANFINARLLDRDQNYYIPLPVGWKLRMKMNNTISSGNVTVLCLLKDF